MVPKQITKTQLLELLRADEALEYVGNIHVNTELRSYYRTRIDASEEESGYIIVYIVE